MSRKKVCFVINPISGGKNKKRVPDMIAHQVDQQAVEHYTEITQSVGHAVEIAQKASNEGFDMVFAIGGDGTVNEVATALVGSKTALGVVPMGSGNGLARHLGIPLQVRKAINLVNRHEIKTIDACMMNGKYFFVTAGAGFDAHIGNLFAQSETRGFKTYVMQTLSEYVNYKPEAYKITINGKEITQEAFLISFANAGQYGNNAYISPSADIADGMVDVCVMKPFHPVFGALDMGMRLFTKRMDGSRSLSITKTDEVVIERNKPGVVHLDGEPFDMPEKLNIKVMPRSLNVVTLLAS